MQKVPEPTSSPHAVGPAPVGPSNCWAQIGVYGNGTCAELVHHVHCRNCPEFARAGAGLLDRFLPPDYQQELTEHYAAHVSAEIPGEISVLIFRLGTEWFGLPTTVVHEVVEARPIHSLPRRRGRAVIGVVNVGGDLLPCVSVSRVLGVAASSGQPETKRACNRLVVIGNGDRRLAFPVEEVGGIERFEVSQFTELPANFAESAAIYTRCILHWNGRVVGCLDEEQLLRALEESLA